MDDSRQISIEYMYGNLPEEGELKEKQLQFEKLKDELTNCQLRLSTLQRQINTFENSYHQIVGILYAELDEVKAQIAEVQLALNPVDQEAIDNATTFRAFAEESAEEAKRTEEQPPRPNLEPTDSLKKLFREAAKRIHPDLANTEIERLRRHDTMTRVNNAYKAGDEAGLQDILQEWNNFQSALEEDVNARLIGTIHKITQVKNSIRQTELAINNLQSSDIGILLLKSKQASWKNRNILLEMAADIRREIVRERERLSNLTGENETL